jgi:hypothetical protein
MAKVSLNQIKQWFETDDQPTQEQFFDVWDSFYHKDGEIPLSSIQNLQNLLNAKASQESVDNLKRQLEVRLFGYLVDTHQNALEDANVIKAGNPIRGKGTLFNGEYIFGEAKHDVVGALTENDIKIYTRWK